jgi:uncharacterized membrane protein
MAFPLSVSPHAVTAAVTSFLGSAVEGVEALTVILAVGTVRGWRAALSGTAGGIVLLVLLVSLFGAALAAIPIRVVQVVVGVLLLAFGVRWLYKAVLRAAGAVQKRDEAAAYDRERAALAETTETAGTAGAGRRAIDWLGTVAAFKAVTLEGLEVVFIVIATGAASGTGGSALVPAAAGATLALILVAAAGIALRAPLARVPENTLKFAVGVILTGFGLFWAGEGLGVRWPGGDASLFVLVASVLVIAMAGVQIGKRRAGQRPAPT